MKKLTPNLMVKDVKKTVDFYKNNFGFELVMAVPETQDGILTEVENHEELYNTLKEKVEVVKELFTTWYGMKEFYICDNNGYVLCFAEQKKN